MTDSTAADRAHAERVICGVTAAAVRDAGAAGVVLLEAGSAPGRMLHDWLARSLGASAVVPGPEPDSDGPEAVVGSIRDEELRRASGRIVARERGLVLAHPACKTVLLLATNVPPERLLPLGDVYASDLERWAGDAGLTAEVADLADAAGGAGALDLALHRWLEERRPLGQALSGLPDGVRRAVAERLRLGRPLRRWPRCVPKLGARTLWVDVFA